MTSSGISIRRLTFNVEHSDTCKCKECDTKNSIDQGDRFRTLLTRGVFSPKVENEIKETGKYEIDFGKVGVHITKISITETTQDPEIVKLFEELNKMIGKELDKLTENNESKEKDE